MKRFISVFAIIATLALILSGCSQPPKILLCGSSDSVPEINCEIEYDKWSKGYYKDSAQPQEMNYTLGNVTFCGKYSGSYVPFGESEQINCYLDETYHCEFALTNKGKLENLFFFDTTDEAEKNIGKEECEKIAVDYLSLISDVNLSEYKKTVEYDESEKRYLFHFDKMSGEIQTMDRVTLTVKSNGKLQAYKASFFGDISIDEIPTFDIDAIENSLKKKIDQITKEVQNSFDSIRYDSIQYCITKISSSEYGIIATADIDFEKKVDNATDTVMIMSEQLQFIIYL